MRYIYLIILSAVSFLAILFGCVEDPDMDTRLQQAKVPEVSETTMEGEASASSITLTARIVKENGLPVKECGVCWSLREGADPLGNMREKRYTKADKIEDHRFTVTLSQLEDSTKYYVYAYAINEIDTAFSKTEGAYTTINGVGEVATLDVDSVTVRATSAQVMGKVKSRGVGIEQLGFYYKKKGQAGDSGLSEQDSVVIYEENDLATVDTFSCRLTNLEPDTWYYVRAFAKNQFGEFAFNVDSFKTTDGKPLVGKLSLIKDSTTFTTADLSAFLLHEGDAPVSIYGFCWSVKERPTVDDDSIFCSNLMEDGRFTGRIQGLESAKKYYARAYAINEFGTVYSEEEITISTKSEKSNIVTFPITSDSIQSDGTVHIGGELQNGGNSAAVEWGICWSSINKEPDLRDSHASVKDSVFMYTLSALKGETDYYVRTYAVNEHNLVGYGQTLTFRTPDIFTEKNIYIGDERLYSASFTLNGQAYIVGGDLGGKRSNELFCYNVGTNEWKSQQECNVAYSHMTAAVYNDRAYIIGGLDKQAGTECQVYTSENNWLPEFPALPKGRFNSVSFVYHDSLYVLGGTDNNSNMNEVVRYDLSSGNGGEWMTVATVDEANQRGGVAFVVNDKVYAGLGEKSNGIRNGFYVSSGDLTTWEPVSSVPEQLATVSSGVYDEQRNSFFMIDNNGKIWEYNLTTEQWISRSVWKPMKNYHLFILDDGAIYILGQGPYQKNIFTLYDPVWDN